jgi:2'-5' RNA ligase
MAMASESAVVVTFPDTETVVGDLRQRLDPSATWGVPAHVTVLYPFVPPEKLRSLDLAIIKEIASTTQAFPIQFTRTSWFANQVLWLPPEPDGLLRQLSARLYAAYPQCPPYGGAILDPIPHLTVADGANIALMREAEDVVAGRLPLSTVAVELTVMTGSREPASWQTLAAFPFSAIG